VSKSKSFLESMDDDDPRRPAWQAGLSRTMRAW